MEHESLDMATAHSRVAMKNAATEQHAERGASAFQIDRRYAGYVETVVQEPFRRRCRVGCANSVARRIRRICRKIE
jgi:hypothetical protein